MNNIGKVLWFRNRDGFGIIVDTKGTEFYFDKSVLPKKVQITKGTIVEFSVNPQIVDVRSVQKIRIPRSAKRLSIILETMEASKSQLQLAI